MAFAGDVFQTQSCHETDSKSDCEHNQISLSHLEGKELPRINFEFEPEKLKREVQFPQIKGAVIRKQPK